MSDPITDKTSTGQSTSIVYRIEARLTLGLPPCEECGIILDAEWRHVPFKQCLIGVPSGLTWNKEAEAHGFVSYESAMALAYWFLASCSRNAVEVRLVPYVFVYSFTATPQEPEPPIEREIWKRQRKAVGA